MSEEKSRAEEDLGSEQEVEEVKYSSEGGGIDKIKIFENSNDFSDDVRNVDVDPFDCGECLEVNNRKNEVSVRADRLAGEIRRKQKELDKLLIEEEKLTEEFSQKIKAIKMRYNLVDEFNWQVNLQDGTAVGKRK